MCWHEVLVVLSNGVGVLGNGMMAGGIGKFDQGNRLKIWMLRVVCGGVDKIGRGLLIECWNVIYVVRSVMYNIVSSGVDSGWW